MPAVADRTVEERLESAERVERSAEIMRRLKRDEARTLMLKAQGLSYVEIGERLGWTYTNGTLTPRRWRSGVLLWRCRFATAGVGLGAALLA